MIQINKTGKTRTRCLLDYKYVKNHQKLIANDLRQQKELDADPKAILLI